MATRSCTTPADGHRYPHVERPDKVRATDRAIVSRRARNGGRQRRLPLSCSPPVAFRSLCYLVDTLLEPTTALLATPGGAARAGAQDRQCTLAAFPGALANKRTFKFGDSRQQGAIITRVVGIHDFSPLRTRERRGGAQSIRTMSSRANIVCTRRPS